MCVCVYLCVCVYMCYVYVQCVLVIMEARRGFGYDRARHIGSSVDGEQPFISFDAQTNVGLGKAEERKELCVRVASALITSTRVTTAASKLPGFYCCYRYKNLFCKRFISSSAPLQITTNVRYFS